MKEIQIKWDPHNTPLSADPYYTPNPSFSWFGKKEVTGYKQVTGWHGCRETFTSELKRKLGTNGYVKDHIPNMTLRFSRILVKFKSKKKSGTADFEQRVTFTDAWMKESVRMLNVIEKYMGWGLSRPYRVSDTTLSGKKLSDSHVIVYALTGSPKWMKATQLLSLYLLFVRLGRLHNHTKVFKSIDDFEALSKSLDSIKGLDGQPGRDRLYFRSIHSKLKLALDNREELFFGSTMKTNYRYNEGWHGINNLLVSHEAGRTIVTRWKKVLKKG